MALHTHNVQLTLTNATNVLTSKNICVMMKSAWRFRTTINGTHWANKSQSMADREKSTHPSINFFFKVSQFLGKVFIATDVSLPLRCNGVKDICYHVRASNLCYHAGKGYQTYLSGHFPRLGGITLQNYPCFLWFRQLTVSDRSNCIWMTFWISGKNKFW